MSTFGSNTLSELRATDRYSKSSRTCRMGCLSFSSKILFILSLLFLTKSYRRCTVKVFCLGLKTCNFIKKRLHHRFFPVKFTKVLRAPILKNICERLLLFLQEFEQNNPKCSLICSIYIVILWLFVLTIQKIDIIMAFFSKIMAALSFFKKVSLPLPHCCVPDDVCFGQCMMLSL